MSKLDGQKLKRKLFNFCDLRALRILRISWLRYNDEAAEGAWLEKAVDSTVWSDDLKHPAGFLHTANPLAPAKAVQMLSFSFIQCFFRMELCATAPFPVVSDALQRPSHLTVSYDPAIQRYPMLSHPMLPTDAPIQAFRQNCFLMCVLVPASLAGPRPSAAIGGQTLMCSQ